MTKGTSFGFCSAEPGIRWVLRSQKFGILTGSPFVGTQKLEIYYGFLFLETRF
jgi:hypothetical protein